MKIRHEEKLISMLDKKAELLDKYKEITEGMNGKSLDEVTEYIAQRQCIINDIEKASKYINDNISKQGVHAKSIMSKIIAFDYNVESIRELDVFTDKVKSIEKVLVSISEAERDVKRHIDTIKEDMIVDMKKNVNNKKIVDYYNTALGVQFNGSKLNSLN